jgi:hypothetical protein
MTANTYHISTNYTSGNKQETRKNKYRNEAVFNAILTTNDGQRRPKHVVCRRWSKSDTQLVMKILKFMLSIKNEF